ncbi:hypothetical protein ScPMuIL_006084 [Solemya velum]
MAQGKLKVKSKLPSGVKHKGSHKQKSHGPRKGGVFIAPKKTKHIEASKLKKGLQRAITANIEQEVKMLAKSVEPKSFHVVGSNKTEKSEST